MSLRFFAHARRASRARWWFVWSLVACSGDRAIAPTDAGSLVVVAGADQEGAPGQTLSGDIDVSVVDKSGAPVSGVRVAWTPGDSGGALPSVTMTGPDGRAGIRWTLGPGIGVHALQASATGYAPVVVHAMATPPTLALDDARTLAIETYDGSGQTVHPDFLSIGPGSRLHGERMAITPYPNGNSLYENPTMYESADRVHWTVPVPSQNPAVSTLRGYLSDPDLVYDPLADEVRMYYRQVDAENDIMLVRSRDGHAWSAPVQVAHAPNHEIVSPAVVRRSADEWLMWSVNGQGGCTASETAVELRLSHDGVTWSPPDSVALAQPGFWPWHIEVQWIPSRQEYWALYNGKTRGSCSTTALFLATSPDGVTWKTFPSPVLERGDIAALRDIVYRSTFSYDADADVVTFWFSGASYDSHAYVWKTVIERRRLGVVMTRISAAPRPAQRALRAGVPPLVDPP